MKILNIMLSKDLGGIQQSFLDYCKIVEFSGYSLITVISKNSQVKSSLKHDDYYEIHNRFKCDFLGIYSLIKILKAHKPDYIICHGNRAIYFCNIAKKFLKTTAPLIAVAHNYSISYLRKSDYIFSVTKYMKDYLIGNNFLQNKIFVFPNIIDIKNYNFSAKIKPQKTIKIGVLARFVNKKAVDVAIDSISFLIELGISLKMIIGGDGEESKRLKNMVAERGLGKYVEFAGWVKDKNEFFKNIDIFCLTSREEPFGIILLEAMASKTPIISTKAEGPREILRNNESAIMVDIDSPEQIAKAISFYITNWDKAEEYSNNALLRVNENYDISSASKLFTEILKKIHNEI